MPDKSTNPIQINLLGANAVVLEAKARPDLLQKRGRLADDLFAGILGTTSFTQPDD